MFNHWNWEKQTSDWSSRVSNSFCETGQRKEGLRLHFNTFAYLATSPVSSGSNRDERGGKGKPRVGWTRLGEEKKSRRNNEKIYTEYLVFWTNLIQNGRSTKHSAPKEWPTGWYRWVSKDDGALRNAEELLGDLQELEVSGDKWWQPNAFKGTRSCFSSPLLLTIVDNCFLSGLETEILEKGHLPFKRWVIPLGILGILGNTHWVYVRLNTACVTDKLKVQYSLVCRRGRLGW